MTHSFKARFATLGILVVLLAACSKQEPPPAPAEPLPLGHYRATLTLPGGELPFGLEIAREDSKYVAYLINGRERVRVPDVTVANGRVEMKMPAFGNTLSAAIGGHELKGTVVLVKKDGKEQVIPFAAEHGVEYRFFARSTTDNADLAGRWAVTFTDEDGKRNPAVGEFEQTHGKVTGTFLTGTGDHRFLAGEMRGDEFALSTFDGAHAYLYRGRINGRNELEGTYWSGLAWRETFSGRRDQAASLGELERATQMRANSKVLEFTFPDLDGKPVSLSDERYKDKVVIIALAGSWCPNCHDEAAFLAPYYKANRERGLEIIELMFEQFGDMERAVPAVRGFRDKFGIEYATLVAGVNDKQNAVTRLPQLNNVFAFPTTIFVDRQHRVRRIHTGFSGPATGAHYERLIEGFDATVEELLAEPAKT
jgi:thiol-disulfide isomerase/thioredoxin